MQEDRRALLRALLAGEIAAAFHLQPIVNLGTGEVAGYEALARFPYAFGAPPDLCFAIAKSFGYGLELEDLLFRQALEMHRTAPANCFLTLNVGPEYLVSDRCGLLLEEKADLGGIVLEVTEESSILNFAAVRERLALIRSLGGAVAVDDAGAGYASLTHILEMKPEFIKVDRQIVQGCDQDRAKSTVIEMLGAAANRLDAWIIAEGIETPGELKELLLLGVPLAQGYFLARPAPEMMPCSAEAAALIETCHIRGSQAHLESLVTVSLRCSSAEEARELLGQQRDRDLAVIVDRWDRPSSVLQRHPLLGVRQLPGFLKTQMDTDPEEVLQRALLRDAGSRYDPIVVIGPEGQYLGMTDVDRLMSSLLGSVFPKSRRPLQ